MSALGSSPAKQRQPSELQDVLDHYGRTRSGKLRDSRLKPRRRETKGKRCVGCHLWFPHHELTGVRCTRYCESVRIGVLE